MPTTNDLEKVEQDLRFSFGFIPKQAGSLLSEIRELRTDRDRLASEIAGYEDQQAASVANEQELRKECERLKTRVLTRLQSAAVPVMTQADLEELRLHSEGWKAVWAEVERIEPDFHRKKGCRGQDLVVDFIRRHASQPVPVVDDRERCAAVCDREANLFDGPGNSDIRSAIVGELRHAANTIRNLPPLPACQPVQEQVGEHSPSQPPVPTVYRLNDGSELSNLVLPTSDVPKLLRESRRLTAELERAEEISVQWQREAEKAKADAESYKQLLAARDAEIAQLKSTIAYDAAMVPKEQDREIQALHPISCPMTPQELACAVETAKSIGGGALYSLRLLAAAVLHFDYEFQASVVAEQCVAGRK